MNYVKSGAGGRNVVLIHGLGASLFSWRETVVALSGPSTTTYAVDLLGFGESAAPAGFPYTAKAQAEAVAAFIKAQHLHNPVTLIGHSMGGSVCLYLAEMAVHGALSLSQMVLVAPVAYSPPRAGEDLAALEAKAKEPGVGALLAKCILDRAYAVRTRVTQAQIDGYAEGLSSDDQIHAFVEHSRNLHQISFTQPQLTQIKFKTLIIFGKDDPFLKPAATVGAQLKTDLSNASLKLIDNCGHIPQEECPVETNDTIVKFLT
jgi:pimeloyl-ACP methyl ester carboxylesterase